MQKKAMGSLHISLLGAPPIPRKAPFSSEVAHRLMDRSRHLSLWVLRQRSNRCSITSAS